MPSMTTIIVRLDAALKRRARKALRGSGFDVSSAIRLFLARAVKKNGMPFAVSEKERKAQVRRRPRRAS